MHNFNEISQKELAPQIFACEYEFHNKEEKLLEEDKPN